MSPILVRPVREQLEHDRIIRLLQARLKRRGDVVVNLGLAQTTPVKIGQVQVFPDLVVFDKSRKLLGTVEVETAESVNHLEAMAEWVHYGRAKVPFHLYVPAGSVEAARRLIAENEVGIGEIWTYHTIGDQTRFTMVHRAPNVEAPRAAAEPQPPAARRPAAPAAKATAATARRATAAKRSSPTTRPAAARKASPKRKAAPAPRKAAGRAAARKAPARKAAPKRAQKRK